MLRAEFAVNKSDLVPLAGGAYAAVIRNVWILPHRGLASTTDRYLSVQPDGTLETRDVVGPWETAFLHGNRLVYSVDGLTWDILVNTDL